MTPEERIRVYCKLNDSECMLAYSDVCDFYDYPLQTCPYKEFRRELQ
jgi:hypothetical protein